VIVRRAACLVLVLATVGIGRAQTPPTSPGSHDSLTKGFSLDEVKSALQRFPHGVQPGGLPPELMDLISKQLGGKGKQVDEQKFKQMQEMLAKNPGLRKMVEDLAKQAKQGKKELTPEERNRLLEQMLQGNGRQPQPPRGVPMPGNPPPIGDPPPLPNNAPPIPMPMPLPVPGGPMPNANPMLPPQGQGPNPFGFEETPREKMARVLTSTWERNVAPLDDTPEVKRAFLELIEGSGDLSDFGDFDGKNFLDDLALDPKDSASLADLFDGAAMGDSWKFDFPSFNFDRPNVDIGNGGGSGGESWWSRNFGGRSRGELPSSGPRSSGSGGFSFGSGGMEGSWWPVVVLAGLLFGSLIAWRFWGFKFNRSAAALGLGGPGWPIDPRRITTRQHVVLAFEYLSVMLCGPRARTWTHNTIAAALVDLAATHGETAVLLARLYELARYAPLDEPLSTAELSEARRIVCALAGLEHE